MRNFYYLILLSFLIVGGDISLSPAFASCHDAYPIGGGSKNGNFPCPLKDKDACSKGITGVPGAYCRDQKDNACPNLKLNICYVDEYNTGLKS
ncbi:MAG: hypothetical protein H0X26_08960 [Alphaproteobacteria bacterium]|nr:hypothetical protein [Alphaproteobacteria bacterium]